jgi:glycosyltransferase involved in cell wall biosynthesis
MHCIAVQSLLPQYIILVINGFSGTKNECNALIANVTPEEIQDRVSIIFVTWEQAGNASYARNIGRSNVISPYVYFLDDDNQFWPEFFAASIAEYIALKRSSWGDILYSPTVLWRMTNIIQSQGIKAFHALCGWLEPVIFAGRKSKIVNALRFLFPLPKSYYHGADYTKASMIWWNSLLSSKQIFDAYPFDENMAFVYEDVDAVYRITHSGIPLIVSNKVRIHHMERDKNKLQQSFLAMPESAYKKSKNRIIFVKKNYSPFQKTIFFIVWMPITSIMTIAFMLFYGGRTCFALIGAYVRGIWDGITSKSKYSH